MAESKTNTLASSGPVPTHDHGEGTLPTDADRPSSIPGPGALIDGKYKVEQLLARGGMGVVYAATHTGNGKRVALKWMLPALGQIKGARDRFMQEARATARIAHPNIVDIYDIGSEQGSAYLVMEYLHGETLADRMCRQRLSVTDALALLMPALRGVAAAHNYGVVHRDLKPENIFLCCTEYGEELEPKVLDFGISKITTDEVRNLALTHSGAVLGTPYYMSPEQVRGARDVDHRADVYALGVILFEVLTGERPFDAETYNELILKIATEPLPSLAKLNPNLDARLIAIVERAMARDPKERFADIKQLALALEPFAGGVRFRNMQTLNPHDKVSGDFPIGPLGPLDVSHADTRPAQAADSGRSAESQIELAALQQQRRSRSAMAAVFASLLACAAAAVYFLSYPGMPPAEPTAAESSKPVPPRIVEDKSAITVAPPPPAAKPALPEPVAVPVRVEPPPAPQPASAVGLGKSGAAAPKRSARASKAALDAPSTPATAEPQAAPQARPHPGEWDRRLDSSTAAPAPVHMPAGHINMNDFR